MLSMDGTKRESILGSFLSEPLLLDFVHLRPQYIRNGRTLELSDLMIEDEPFAIIVQLKTQNLEEAKAGRDSKRWARKNLIKASNQVIGSIKRLQKSDILVKSPSRGEIIFEKKTLLCKHGIVILDYDDDPFVIDNSLPIRYNNSVTIHYFSHDDFVILCQNLMTLPDLIEYLDERAKIPAWSTPMLNDEKNTYAYYCTHESMFDSTLRRLDFEKQWERLTKDFSKDYKEKLHEDKLAEIFTQIIREMSNVDSAASKDFPDYIEKITSKHDILRVKATRGLNRLRRLHRREISKILIEKMERADNSPLGFNFGAFTTADNSMMYLILASRHERKKRIEELQTFTFCLNNITDATSIIGIATENLSSTSGRSFDFFMIEDIEKDEDPKILDDCKKFFGNLKFNRIYDFPKDKPKIIE